MDIRSFMLTTGQELIARLVRVTGTGYVIKSPLVAHMMRGEGGAPSLGFAPWSLLHKDDEEVELLDHALLARPVEIEKQVADSYIQNTTGIVLAGVGGGQILHG